MHKIENHELITQMRRFLVPYWCSSESGGIFVAPAGDSEGERIASCTHLISHFPDIDPESEDKWYCLAGNVLKIVTDFFRLYRLEPGIYTITNNLRLLVEDGEASLDMSGRSRTTVPMDSSIDFTVTQDHIKLIGCMNTRMLDSYVEIMDFKRPYGDCAYYYIDMAEIFGEPIPRNPEGEVSFPRDTEERYYRLHTEMLFAVQAFWTYATPTRP